MTERATKATPPSVPEAPALPARKTVPASPGHKQWHETLRDFIAYYRAELQRITGPSGGVNRGGPGPIIAARAEGALMVIEALADWGADGQPSPAAVLTEEERERWKWAKRNGMPVPAEIEAQL